MNITEDKRHGEIGDSSVNPYSHPCPRMVTNREWCSSFRDARVSYFQSREQISRNRSRRCGPPG